MTERVYYVRAPAIVAGRCGLVLFANFACFAVKTSGACLAENINRKVREARKENAAPKIPLRRRKLCSRTIILTSEENRAAPDQLAVKRAGSLGGGSVSS